MNAFEVNDSLFVYADNDEGTRNDDTWFKARVTHLAAGVCPQDGTTSQLLTFNGQSSAFSADSVGIGAPLRTYEYYTFGTTTVGGSTFLARRNGSGDWVPITGPLRSSNGLEFVYRDANGAVTSTATDVRQVEVIVRTGGDVLSALGTQAVSDSISTWIYLRN